MKKTSYNYLIIGGGIAGVTAAEAIRTRDQESRIAILSAERHPLYSRVLLPSYLKNKIARERVFLRTPDDFVRARIDLYQGTEAVAVDGAAREVRTVAGDVFSFDKLLIASGGRVKHWGPWQNHERVYRMQTIEDADRLHTALPAIREPLVIGSSFIALEFIEIFLTSGVMPRVLVRDAGFFGAFLDSVGMDMIAAHMAERGVICFFGNEAEDVAAHGGQFSLRTTHAGTIAADAIAVGIGVERNMEFLAGSGVESGARGVRTDEYLETNVPGIFAAGDIAEYFDPVSHVYHTAGNWAHATAQGMRAGLNMTGERAAFDRVPSYGITCMGMHFAAIGVLGGAMRSMTRVRPQAGVYERLFLQDGRIAGAFLINGRDDRAHITSLISSRMPVGPYENMLQDPLFDIHTIPLVK